MKQLVMVYNADSGRVHAAIDTLHKLLSPATYACNLCRLTYGPVGMKREWRAFLESLGVAVRFLHRDEYVEGINESEVAFPVILLSEGDTEPVVLLDAKAIGSMRSLTDLMDMIGEKLSATNIVERT